ncbi:hypothetical protein C8R45DRAFT_1075354 [Mycena sanguinolenta]|nr:hypothetical protein C8R45DRAFT_1075354 [Mycena sanguinolenta]
MQKINTDAKTVNSVQPNSAAQDSKPRDRSQPNRGAQITSFLNNRELDGHNLGVSFAESRLRWNFSLGRGNSGTSPGPVFGHHPRCTDWLLQGYFYSSLIASLQPIPPSIATSHILMSYPVGVRGWLAMFKSRMLEITATKGNCYCSRKSQRMESKDCDTRIFQQVIASRRTSGHGRHVAEPGERLAPARFVTAPPVASGLYLRHHHLPNALATLSEPSSRHTLPHRSATALQAGRRDHRVQHGARPLVYKHRDSQQRADEAVDATCVPGGRTREIKGRTKVQVRAHQRGSSEAAASGLIRRAAQWAGQEAGRPRPSASSVTRRTASGA